MRRQVGAVALLVGLAGCGGGDDQGAAELPLDTSGRATTTTVLTTTTAPLETTTTAAPVDEEAAIIAAYLGYWDAFFTVTNPGQPDHPIIDETTVGAAHDLLVQVATERLAEGTVFEFPETSVASHDPIVVAVNGDTAVVGDCFVDDSRRRDLTSGSVDGDAVASKLIESGLVREANGRWRVARGTVLERWEGVAGCAID